MLFRSDELPERKMSEVPHPFVIETMKRFESESIETQGKIYFIHFNHSNPLMWNEGRKAEFKRGAFHLTYSGLRL